MEPDPLPTVPDLEAVMEILGLADPVFIMKDHSDARRRAELLARIAAATVDRLAAAERLADLDVDDRADLHWDADREVATPPRQSLDRVRLLDLQLARLAWVTTRSPGAAGRDRISWPTRSRPSSERSSSSSRPGGTGTTAKSARTSRAPDRPSRPTRCWPMPS
jgi:hypothetical protein